MSKWTHKLNEGQAEGRQSAYPYRNLDDDDDDDEERKHPQFVQCFLELETSGLFAAGCPGQPRINDHNCLRT